MKKLIKKSKILLVASIFFLGCGVNYLTITSPQKRDVSAQSNGQIQTAYRGDVIWSEQHFEYREAVKVMQSIDAKPKSITATDIRLTQGTILEKVFEKNDYEYYVTKKNFKLLGDSFLEVIGHDPIFYIGVKISKKDNTKKIIGVDKNNIEYEYESDQAILLSDPLTSVNKSKGVIDKTLSYEGIQNGQIILRFIDQSVIVENKFLSSQYNYIASDQTIKIPVNQTIVEIDKKIIEILSVEPEKMTFKLNAPLS